MNVKSLIVVGAGMMGGGIAQVCAQHGIDVMLCDIRSAALQSACSQMRWSLAKLAAKGLLDEAPETVMSRVLCREKLASGCDADLAIEAVDERRALKQEIFRRLDQVCPDKTLLASNTSSLSISGLAAETRRPDRVLGLHFFNPVPLMQAVEVIRGDQTDGAVMTIGEAFVRQLGKVPIVVNQDIPGFVVNRINLPSIVEAMRLVEAGIVSVRDVDEGMKLATGRRMGIFETGDLVGLDVTLDVLDAIHARTGDPRWKPPRILQEKVDAGHLGRKRGRGWYVYTWDDAATDLSGR